jgi:hypothetical protein
MELVCGFAPQLRRLLLASLAGARKRPAQP